MEKSDYYVGLMSGTSADAIDVVVVDFTDDQCHLIGSHSQPLSQHLRTQIHRLASPSDNEIDRMGELDQQLGQLFATTVNELLHRLQLSNQQICAIGSHGQTIRHRPPGTVSIPFTLQIGDPNVIAQQTGITTIADFRRRDMAAGGQGAPLVPAFHKAIFQHPNIDRVIINIGGMSNVTWLPMSGRTTGFDTGPGNALMDLWIQESQGKPYDADGTWARSGKVNPELLKEFLSDPFFDQPPPKSTGRETFNTSWLKSIIKRYAIPTADIQATLLALTVQSIADDIKKLGISGEAFVCGGGSYNKKLMEELRLHLPTFTVESTVSLGIAPEWIEAMAFAWMAKNTLNHRSSNIRAVTGAQKEVILGGVYFA